MGLAEGRKGLWLWAEERPVADPMAKAWGQEETVPGSLESYRAGLQQA